MAFPCVRLCKSGSNDATVGDVAWSQSDKIAANTGDVTDGTNANQAYVSLTPGQTSQALVAKNFPFSSLYGKIHADSIIDGVNFWLHVFQPGSDASTNTGLEVFKVAPVIAGVIGTWLDVSIPLGPKCDDATAAQRVQVTGTRDATTGLPDDLWDDGGGNDIDYGDVTNTGFGIAFRVRNTDGAKTSKVVCSCVHAELVCHTAATSAVIVSNASDETGATESGQTPFFLYVDASESKFGTNNPLWAYCKWTFTLPTGESIVIDDARPGGTVSGANRNLCKVQRKMQAAIPILPGQEGVTHVRLDLYGDYYADLLGTDEIDVLVNTSTRTVKLIKAVGGDYTTIQAAATAASATSNVIYEFQGGATHQCGSSSPEFTGDNLVFRVKSGTGTATLEQNGSANSSYLILSGNRNFLDLRNATLSDSDLGAVDKYFFVRSGGGDDTCIWGATSTSEITDFYRVLGTASLGSRLFVGNCHLDEVKFYGLYIYDTCRVVITDFIATAASDQGTNGFVRFGMGDTSDDSRGMGVTCYFGENDCATFSKSWNFRSMGSWVQMQGFYAHGIIPSNDWGHSGLPRINGSYCFDYDACYMEADYDVGNVFNKIHAHYTSFRNCYFTGVKLNNFNIDPSTTPIQLHLINNTAFVYLYNGEQLMGHVDTGTNTWFLPCQMFAYNNVIKTDPNIGGGDGSGITGSKWYGDNSQTTNSPVLILGASSGNLWPDNASDSTRYQRNDTSYDLAGWNALSVVGTDYEDTTVLTDYPVAADFEPDSGSTAARTGTALVAGQQSDYRLVIRASGANSYLGCTSGDAAPAAPTADPPTITATGRSSDALIGITPDTDAERTRIKISTSQGGPYTLIDTVLGDVTSYTVELN